MHCRNCGTEIADRAIVCYRCGHPTTDPVRKAVPVRPPRRPLFFLIVAAVLLVLAGYIGYESREAADPDRWQMVSGALAGAAAVVIILGLVRRRR